MWNCAIAYSPCPWTQSECNGLSKGLARRNYDSLRAQQCCTNGLGELTRLTNCIMEYSNNASGKSQW